METASPEQLEGASSNCVPQVGRGMWPWNDQVVVNRTGSAAPVRTSKLRLSKFKVMLRVLHHLMMLLVGAASGVGSNYEG